MPWCLTRSIKKEKEFCIQQKVIFKKLSENAIAKHSQTLRN
jgi:hypothetical protein